MYKAIDLVKYPFLTQLNELLNLKYPNLKIEDILNNTELYPFNRALEILESIVTKNTIFKTRINSEDEIIAFYSLLIGAITIGDRALLHRIAVAYSKQTSSFLNHETIDNIVLIARKIGLDVELTRDPPKILIDVKRDGSILYIAKPVSIDLKQYLEIISKKLAHDPKYMLVNQIVENSRVFIDKEVLIRLIEELVYRRIIEYANLINFNPDKITLFISKYREILEKNNWFRRKPVIESGNDRTEVKNRLVVDKLPPCMKNILSKIESSENPSHHERFALASFLVNIGLEIDSILEIFRKTPDFNERIARYQVEHISGLRGSRRKYLPYNCDNMKSLGICPINDYCSGGKNPLTIYRRNIRSGKYVDKE